MNCCNSRQDGGDGRERNHRRGMSHMRMMLLCCGAPFLILLLLPAIGSFIPGAGAVIGRILPFLCPLMMLLMLPMMLRGSKRDKNSDNRNYLESGRIESNRLE
jgi:hypothetical protein